MFENLNSLISKKQKIYKSLLRLEQGGWGKGEEELGLGLRLRLGLGLG